MAGSYPDLFASRMVIDRDGAVLFTFLDGVQTVPSEDSLAILNNESADDLGVTTNLDYYIIGWGNKRDLRALYLGFVQTDPDTPIDVRVMASVDTNTGADGTWFELFPSNTVQSGSSVGWWGHVAPGDYRRYIRAVPDLSAAMGLRAIKIEVLPSAVTSWRLVSAHIFGEYSVGLPNNDPKALAMWEPAMALNRRVAPGHLDYGNVAKSSSEDRSFRVCNISARYIAMTVDVSVSVLTDADPQLVPQFLLSVDGGKAFTKEVRLPNLVPGAVSGEVIIRRVTPSDAQPGPWAARVMFGVVLWQDTLVTRPGA